jgi:TolA-binding protein
VHRARVGARPTARRTSRAERRAARLVERAEHTSRDGEEQREGVQLAAASYADLVRAGAFEQVVDAATQAGLAQTLERNGAEDVRALADAARYLHRTELAVRSLTVLRARFPGTHHSAAAAFLLGRTYENAEQAQAARRFYELYERESPNGEFAAEALAGRMRIVASRAGGESVSAGRALAQEYLERYPRGVHAKTARELLR